MVMPWLWPIDVTSEADLRGCLDAVVHYAASTRFVHGELSGGRWQRHIMKRAGKYFVVDFGIGIPETRLKVGGASAEMVRDAVLAEIATALNNLPPPSLPAETPL